MILEEIDGNLVVTIMKQNGAKVAVAVGDHISDHESSTISVIGTGKVIVRVDPNCTFEIKGVVAETEVVADTQEPVDTTVEAAPVVEVVAPEVETTSEVAKEPTKK